MAKLNGVNVVIPAQAEKITYNGAEYVKTDAAAKVGDIIRIGDEDCSYLTDGGYYEVTRLDSCDDAQIIDDDGDEFDTAALDEPVTVFAKVEAVTKPAEDNAEYGKVKAKVGDRIRITNVWGAFGKYANGDEFVVTSVRADGVVHVAEHDRPIAQNEYDVIAPAAADTIVHNGVTYRKVSRKAKEGDKYLVCTTSRYGFFTKGKVYEIYRLDSDGDPRITDDDGGDGVLCGDDGENYAVLESLADASTAKLPPALPSDYVIHEGAVYRKESRKAEVGEKVVALRNSVDVYDTGHIGVYTGNGSVNFSGQGNSYVCKDGNWACSHPNYAVLVQTDTVTIGGVEYTLEKRKADVGDTVLVVAAEQAAGNYANGTISTIESESCGEPAINGRFLYRREYFVLVPKASATSAPKPAPIYTEVKRKANVGERIRIVDATIADGYANGDEFTVKSVHRDMPGHSDHVYVNGVSIAVLDKEYVVLEDAKPAPANRLKVGDYAKVTEKCFEYKAGDIVKVAEKQSNGCFDFRVERVGDDGTHYADESFLVHATDAEVAAAKRKAAVDTEQADIKRRQGEFKPGDKAVIVSTSAALFGFDVGDTVTIADRYDPTGCVYALNVTKLSGDSGYCDAVHLRKLSAEDIETAKWAKLGRKVGEFKAGDIVKVNPGSNGHAGGTIGTLVSGAHFFFPREFGVLANGKTYDHTATGFTLVAPVESLFN